MSTEVITTYRLKHLPGAQCIRRPASILPENGKLCFIDRGTATRADRYCVATFVDGEWRNSKNRPLASPPTYWTEMVPDA
jgi:hypothetical protein